MKCTLNPCWFRKSLDWTVIKIHFTLDFYRFQSQTKSKRSKRKLKFMTFCPLYWDLCDWPRFGTIVENISKIVSSWIFMTKFLLFLTYFNFRAKNWPQFLHPKLSHLNFRAKKFFCFFIKFEFSRQKWPNILHNFLFLARKFKLFFFTHNIVKWDFFEYFSHKVILVSFSMYFFIWNVMF